MVYVRNKVKTALTIYRWSSAQSWVSTAKRKPFIQLKTNECTEEVSVSLRRDLGGCFCVCLRVYGEDISSMLTEYIYHRLGWALICRYLCSTSIQSPLRCPSASLINWDAEQHKHAPRSLITEWLPVTLSVRRPNQPSSPADNALWKPSPWELLHMLWVVVKETWLNNVPSCLSSPDSLVHSVPVLLRCENSCALTECWR